MMSVFMPAYQTGTLLATTVGRIPAEAWECITTLHIINDGSRDETGVIADALALANPKIQVHHFAHNQGYGAVVRAGLKWCLADSAEVVACLHGDGQYAPELLYTLYKHMQAQGLDVLQGSRLAKRGALAGGMPLYKWLAGQALCALENRVLGLRMTDYHSGYLLYSSRFVAHSGYAEWRGQFEIDLELIVAARARGFRVGEFAIATRYADETSHLNPIAYGFRVLAVLWRYVRGHYG